MAGPSIAKAEVTVDLDGKRLLAEAKALGEEAGQEAGEAHSKAFNDEVEKGYGDLRKATAEDLKEAGRINGEDSGEEFSKAFRSYIISDGKKSANELAQIFGDEDFGGLNGLKNSFKDVDSEVGRVDAAMGHIKGLLEDAEKSGGINAFQFGQIASETADWYSNARLVAEQLDATDSLGLKQDLSDAARSAQNLADESKIVSDHLNSIRTKQLDQMVDDFFSARDAAEEFDGKIGSLKTDVDDLARGHILQLGQDLQDIFGDDFTKLPEFHKSLVGANGDSHTLADTVKLVSGKIDEFGAAAESSEGHLAPFRKTLADFAKPVEDVVKGAEGVVKGIDNIGGASDRNGKKVESLGSKLKGLLSTTSSFDPTDNPMQAFLLILALAGPIAPLVGALAGQTLILAAAAAAGAFGVGGLIAGFEGLQGKFGPLNKDATAAASAFKGLLTPLKQLGVQLTNSEFKGLAKPFQELGAALPKLGPGVTAIGSALNGFLKGLTTAITTNIGGINSLLTGFAPIITNLGKVFTSLGGILGGVLKAATPFADAFTKSLADGLKKFSDFLNAAKGQNVLTKFFTDAQPIMADVLGVFTKFGSAFAAVNTQANKSGLHDTLVGLGDAVGALVGVGGSLGGVIGAAGQLLSALSPVVSALIPVGKGVSDLALGVVAFLKPIIAFITSILAPAFTVIGDILTTVGSALSALAPAYSGFFGGISAAIAPAQKAVTDFAKAYGDFIQQALKIAAPAFKALGDSFSVFGTALGDLFSGLIGAGKQTDAFKGTASGLQGFLQGPFKDAVTNVAGFFKQVAAVVRDQLIPYIKEIDWTSVTKGLDQIAGIIPKVIDAIGTIATALGANISAFGAWAGALLTAVGGVVSVIVGAGKTVGDVLTGNFGAAAKDGGKALNDVVNASANLRSGVSDAMGKTKAAIDLTNEAQKHLATDANGVNANVKAAFADFSKAGSGNLAALATKMGLTGDSAAAFRGVIQDAAKKSGTSLSDLASAKSLPDLENRLGLTGQAAKDKFEAAIKAATGGAGDAIDKLPPKVQTVIGKMIQLDGQKANPHIGITGDTTAISAVDSVRNALNAINGKTSTVTIITKQVGSGAAGAGAIGGIVAGGQYVAGARKYASGGILNSPSWLSPFALAGESGSEAIVPLSRPLSQIDPSVRNLAAYAQGLNATTDKVKAGATVMSGAIQIITPAADPAIVATQALDRLVPLL